MLGGRWGRGGAWRLLRGGRVGGAGGLRGLNFGGM